MLEMRYTGLATFRNFLVMAAIGLTMLVAVAHANGRVTEFQRQVAGPYEIAVGTIPGAPVVGTLHLTMTVTDVASKTPILDAVIAVTGRGPEPDATEVGPLTAVNNPTDPVFYDATTFVDRVGDWTFTVAVSSGLGDATADFGVEVASPSSFGQMITWIAVVVFFVLIVLGLTPLLRQWTRRRAAR